MRRDSYKEVREGRRLEGWESEVSSAGENDTGRQGVNSRVVLHNHRNPKAFLPSLSTPERTSKGIESHFRNSQRSNCLNIVTNNVELGFRI